MKENIFVLILILIAFPVFAQRKNPHINTANRLYRENKFDRSITEYLKAMESNRNDPVISYNLGNAFYRNTKFNDAEKTFDNTIINGPDSSMKQKGYYNKGVSLSKQQKLEESIEAYKMAVKLDPTDKDARINLQKALLELKKRNPQPEEKKQEKKQQQKKKSEQPQSKLTKKQVEQLLKALEQREQQVQQKMQQKQRTAGRQEKDW